MLKAACRTSFATFVSLARAPHTSKRRGVQLNEDDLIAQTLDVLVKKLRAEQALDLVQTVLRVHDGELLGGLAVQRAVLPACYPCGRRAAAELCWHDFGRGLGCRKRSHAALACSPREVCERSRRGRKAATARGQHSGLPLFNLRRSRLRVSNWPCTRTRAEIDAEPWTLALHGDELCVCVCVCARARFFGSSASMRTEDPRCACLRARHPQPGCTCFVASWTRSCIATSSFEDIARQSQSRGAGLRRDV